MALEQRMTGLDQAIQAISQDGGWNQNAYMRGLANGMLIAKGILEGRQHQLHPEPIQYTDDALEAARAAAEPPVKRGPGRPPGAKNLPKKPKVEAVVAAAATDEYDYEAEVGGAVESTIAGVTLQHPTE